MNCKFCQREINNRGSLAAHENVCMSNPNRIKYKHSPNAGQKKGSIPWNKGKKVGLTEYHRSIRRSDEEVFVEGSTYTRRLIKKRILDQNMIPHVCDVCELVPEWNGKPMPLILDHKNGINDDNRIENLRFVCSNCDSQLPTYKSRNRKGG